MQEANAKTRRCIGAQAGNLSNNGIERRAACIGANG
jgi:hypothetical protein